MKELRDRLAGELVLPADPEYRAAVRLQNTEFDRTAPSAVVYCETPDDVSVCVRHAQDHGLRTHVRSGGHSFNGWSTGEGLVIDLSRINQVGVDSTGGTPRVRLGAGTQSLDALAALRPEGLQIATGTFPTVAVGGFLSGGGIGWQTRKFGVGSDRVVAARVVLADGRAVLADARHHPDLFWALRGGGGGTFGIVTEFEVRPIAAPRMTAFETLWAYEDAARVIAAWQSWCADGPEELGSSLVVLPGMFGPQGRPTVKVWGVHLGPTDTVLAALDELAERAAAKPLEATVRPRGEYGAVMHESLCGSLTVAQCHRTGTDPGAQGHRHPFTRQSYRFVGRPLTVAEAAGLLDAWGGEDGSEKYLLSIAVGGAANGVDPAATAYPHRGAAFLIGCQMASRAPETSAAITAELTGWADRCEDVLLPLSCGSYINFPSSRRRTGWERDYFGSNYDRLAAVKRAYDPDSFFHHSNSVRPAPGPAAGTLPAHPTTEAAS